MKYLLIISLVVLLISCSGKHPPLETATHVDLEKYAGKWYEISSIPQRFQRGCTCTTAEYEINGDHVSVINTCRDERKDGELRTAEGKAFVANKGDNSKLKVQFFWPFKGDYWIVELGDNYEYAAVGAPGRDYLWILSRTPQMEDALYQDLLERLEAKKFPIDQLQVTDQHCFL